MYQGLSNFSTMLPGVIVNVRYKCGYVHLFPHMTALHTVSYAQHFSQYFLIFACATVYLTFVFNISTAHFLTYIKISINWKSSSKLRNLLNILCVFSSTTCLFWRNVLLPAHTASCYVIRASCFFFVRLLRACTQTQHISLNFPSLCNNFV
jgi:hypothetical protein